METDIHVYLVDEQALIRDMLRASLEAYGGFQVVGDSADAEQAYAESKEREPHLIVSGTGVEGGGAMPLAAEIKKNLAHIKFVFLASSVMHVFIDESLRLNVDGYLLRSDSLDCIVGALRDVCDGQKRYSDEVKALMTFDEKNRFYRVDSCHQLTELSDRQVEVFRQLSRGRTVKQIARAMDTTERAIESHQYRIMRKLGLRDRVDLVLFAVREGLIIP